MSKSPDQYEFEELIVNESFISYILNGTDKSEWELLIDDNPQLEKKFVKARNLILLLHNTKFNLNEKDREDIKRKIIEFREKHNKSSIKSVKIKDL